jgi:yecA family protein
MHRVMFHYWPWSFAMSDQNASRFERLSQSLKPIDPAELHGLLCGLLCTDASLDRDQWLREAREALADEREFSQILEEPLLQLFDENVNQIDKLEEPVTPLLPDDDAPLSERVRALGNWCQGLLYGLGLGESGWNERLSAESQEFLRDVADIAHIGFETDEGNEADENAYAEVVEYLRIGLMLIWQDNQPAAFRAYLPET